MANPVRAAIMAASSTTIRLWTHPEDYPEMRVSGVEFYNTVKETGVLKTVYRLAEKKVFDIYDLGTGLALRFSKVLAYMHNGVLPTYLAWCFLGMGILFYILLR